MLDIGRGADVAVGLFPKVEFDARSETPVERYFVNRRRWLSAIHRGVIMPGRIKMSTVVRAHLDVLESPRLAVRELVVAEAHHGFQIVQAVLMTEILDLWLQSRRVGFDPRPKRHGNVHKASCHDRPFA